MQSPNPEAIVADHNALIEQTLSQISLSNMPFWIQVASIIVAVLLGWILARRINTTLKIINIRWKSPAITHRCVHFLLTLTQRITFSVFSGLLLFIITYSVKELRFLAPDTKLYALILTYRLLYAWAIFVIAVEFLVILFDGRMPPKVKRLIYTTFWSLAVLDFFGILSHIVEEMQTIALPIGSGKFTLWTLLVGILTVLLAVAIANWLSKQLELSIQHAKDINDNLKIVLARILRVGLFTIAILIALSSAGIDLTVLSIFGGAVGVGLGFGLQKIASNYVSGFIILFDHSINIGDMIEVNGFSGKVTQINTRYSVVRNLRGEEMIIPNESFVSEKVKNFSRTERSLVTSVDVSIDYSADVEKALAIMVDIVSSQPRLVATRTPSAVVTNFGADGIDLRVNFWVEDPDNGTGLLKSNIMRQILIRFAEANISIPYQIRDLRLTGELNVKHAEGDTKVQSS